MQERHTWECTQCKKDGDPALFYALRDDDAWRRHESSKRHQKSLQLDSSRNNMRDAQKTTVAKRYFAQLDSAGSILVIVAWMMICNISMRLFPAVRCVYLSPMHTD